MLSESYLFSVSYSSLFHSKEIVECIACFVISGFLTGSCLAKRMTLFAPKNLKVASMISNQYLIFSISIQVALFSFCPMALANSTSDVAPASDTSSMPYPETESYRLKILSADLLSLGLTLVARMFVEDDTPALLGLASWIALSPIVHCMNGNNRSASISLTMRLTLPIVTGLILSSTNELDPAAIFTLLGFISLESYDIFMLAEKSFSPVRFVVLPTQDGLQMAMAGRF